MSQASGGANAAGHQSRCSLCTREVNDHDAKSVVATFGRSEYLDCDDERLFRESQDLIFCHLDHANEYFANNPVADKWVDTAIDDSGVGLVGGVVVGAVRIAVLVGFGTGLAVIVRSVIHLLS